MNAMDSITILKELSKCKRWKLWLSLYLCTERVNNLHNKTPLLFKPNFWVVPTYWFSHWMINSVAMFRNAKRGQRYFPLKLHFALGMCHNRHKNQHQQYSNENHAYDEWVGESLLKVGEDDHTVWVLVQQHQDYPIGPAETGLNEIFSSTSGDPWVFGIVLKRSCKMLLRCWYM